MSQYRVVNPATGTVEREFPNISDADLTKAIETADAAHRGWSLGSTIAERAALVQKVADLHTERREELADTAVREMGKPVAQALGEVDFSADIYAYYAENAANFLADEPITLRAGDGSALIRRNSLGVLLGVMPWNFPYYQVARFAGPNLIVGNTILLKHASQTPASAEAMQKIFLDAGFPAGAYTNIYASNEQIETVIAHPALRGVSLTGSERAGAAVAEAAGRNLKKVVLELGGADPFIVLGSKDMDATVAAAVFARDDNNGQSCNAGKRFIVLDKFYDEFVEKFTSAVSTVVPGDPSDPDTELGPLSSASAADHLQEQLDQAVADGATATKSADRNGTFFAPVVLTDLKPGNRSYYEEFFGPVAIIHRATDEADAVRIANDTPFGLGSYVFTDDADQAMRVADQIEAGMVFVNLVGADGAELPFGGVKRSGFGRELGRFGAEEFVNKKLIRVG